LIARLTTRRPINWRYFYTSDQSRCTCTLVPRKIGFLLPIHPDSFLYWAPPFVASE
jgi:hypothetical protein